MNGRNTKLAEDQAHCLVGILDISMPVIYGEGQTKAIRRLKEEIARNCRMDLDNSEAQPTSRESQWLNSQGSSQQQQPRTERQRLLLESLKLDNMNERRNWITKADAGTCHWILEHPIYKDWETSQTAHEHRGLLWIKGKPGAGKSTIVRFIHDHTEQHKQPSDIVASFFFNARGAESERSTNGMWKSLLAQLLTTAPHLQHILEKVRFGSSHDTDTTQWTIPVLSQVFVAAVQELGDRPLSCFIDALDECDEQEIRAMVQCFEDIGEEVVNKGRRVQVCFASRHYPNITPRFGQKIVLEAQAGHGHDLSKYVLKHLKLPKSKRAEQIKTEIQEKANGVFMWVVLVTRILNVEFDRGRLHAVADKLRHLPPELSDLFKDILGRDKDNMSETLLASQWILFAARPLTKEEYYCAVASVVSSDHTELIT